MPAYRFLYRDVLSGQLLGELPLESCTYGETLNKPGSFSATMALRPETGVQTITSSTLKPGSTALYVERDGVIVWAGLLWTADGNVDGNEMNLAGAGFMSYFAKREIRSSLAFASADQASVIAQTIIATAQIQYGSIVVIDAYSTPATGILRDRTYYAYEGKPVLEAIEQLAGVRDGFDFRTSTNSSYATTLVTQFPATGRKTSFVLDMDANVELLSFSIDATNIVNTVTARGAGEGDTGLNITAVNAPGILEFPLYEQTVSYTDVRDAATLEAHAKRALDRGKQATLMLKVALYTGMEPGLGAFIVGDVVRVKGSYGWLSVDDSFRITEWTCNVDSNGGERTELSLAPLELFTSA